MYPILEKFTLMAGFTDYLDSFNQISSQLNLFLKTGGGEWI
jgi:hypothetical protein